MPRYSPDKTCCMLRAGLLSFPTALAEQRVGEGVISKRAETEVQRGKARALGGGILPLVRARTESEQTRGASQGRLGRDPPLRRAASHILASPWRDVSVFDGTLPANSWAVAAPGYLCTLAADCIWVYPRGCCQPESLLIHAVEEGTWILALDTGLQLPTGLLQGWPLPKTGPAPPQHPASLRSRSGPADAPGLPFAPGLG